MNDVQAEARRVEIVRDYYGRVLRSSADLKTSACCLAESLPGFVRDALGDVHPEVRERFYGCGSPIPPAIEGAVVLDLGCGSGRDVFVLSKLVGPNGRVIGVDMTDEQLEVARRHVDWHAQRLGYANVELHAGFIEDLGAIGIADESVDVVISNCVMNLSPDKPRCLREIFRVLVPGGELYFSDVFADRRVPPALADDPVLIGECLGGALYTEDFRRAIARVGCLDARTVSSAPIAISDPGIAQRVGDVRFVSNTVRAFKLDLEDRCEDFGQVATYLGSEPHHPEAFVLDDHHCFETDRPMRVCGNTADMLERTRYARHFRVSGDRTAHRGLFDCGPSAAGCGPDSSSACC